MCTFQVAQHNMLKLDVENLRKMCLQLENFFIVFSANTYEIKYLVLILKIHCNFSCIPSTILS